MDVRQYEICKTYQLLFGGSGLFPGTGNISRRLGNPFFYPGLWYDMNDTAKPPYVVEEAVTDEEGNLPPASVAVASSGETLCADTEYVLEETDILRGTSVETSWKIPHKYIGMDRENFLETMDLYAEHPPLSEIERGFVGLEVLSFSRDRVVVRMDYRYVQPSESFYLAVTDHEVVVYLEDRTTVYINTGIALEDLPETLQLQIMDMLFVPDEETLYDFWRLIPLK